MDTFFRFGLEAGWTQLVERLDEGPLDSLAIGDVNLTFRIAQHRMVQMRIGLGWRYMADQQGAEHGFNYSLAFDIFPVRPLVISESFDIGMLGEAFFLHNRTSLGFALGPVELFAGYDVMLIGPVLFHGPLSGLRLWL